MIRLFAALAYGFLLAPLVIVFIVSVSDDPYLNFPPHGFSLHWYVALAQNAPMLQAARTSVVLAGIVTLVALLTGVPAAFALARQTAPAALSGALSAPLLLPTLIIGLGLLLVLQPLGLVATWPGLALGHLVVVLPFVVRLMTSAFEALPIRMVHAALSLGAPPWLAFLRVTLPMALPGVIASATLAFLVSFDETVISLFLVGPRMVTLPIALFHYAESRTDPQIAALAVVLVVFSALVVLLVDRIAGFTRIMAIR